MKRTQNEKILQIKNETLVVGIDIGKENHYARSFDNRRIEQAKLLRFSNMEQAWAKTAKRRVVSGDDSDVGEQ